MADDERFSRGAMLLGGKAMERLSRAHVAIVGLGGVGSYAAEAVARSGIGEITLVDCDVVSVTNINRQLCALGSTVGRLKCDVMAERARDINPGAVVHALNLRYSPETAAEFFARPYDYIIDAIDTLSAKADLILRAHELDIPIISALGTGNKLDPSALEFADIYATSVCPLARALRQELRRLGIARHEALYSKETPSGPTIAEGGRNVPGSIAWVPGCAGLMLAGRVITRLAGLENAEVRMQNAE